MSQLIKMQKGFAMMLVPPVKLEEYRQDGWTEIERVEMTGDSKPAKPEPKPEKTPADAPGESTADEPPADKPAEKKKK